MKDFYSGKTIVITGASSGIGYDLAEYLAGFGVRLALVARRVENLEELAGRCRQLGSEALVLPGDVTDMGAMLGIRDRTLEAFNRVDIVVGNAGVGGLNPAVGFDLEIHRRTVAINLVGLANTLVPFIPHMVERGSGVLVGVSSLAAFRGLPKAASYSSTKGAQKILLESLRVDLRPYGVSVCSIHPGFVVTPMTDHDEFRMPFKISARRSSILMARAMMKKKPVYLYPWQMRILTFFNRLLPIWLYDRLVPHIAGQKEDVRAHML